MSNLDTLVNRLGLTEAHLPFVRQALTHRSALQQGGVSYERLEFLGDRVLALGVAMLLQEVFPDEDEGALARRHAVLVKESTLAQVAREWELGPLVVLGSSEKNNGGVDKDSILADVVEALLAVMWQEAGTVRTLDFIRATWTPLLVVAGSHRDAKTALQEVLQARKMPAPVYDVAGTSGPEHDRIFTVDVRTKLGDAQGSGRNKKEAETAAAAALLDKKGLRA